jgi:radical SAM superfamily enzyme YgiQ (UPF0313 family)
MGTLIQLNTSLEDRRIVKHSHVADLGRSGEGPTLRVQLVHPPQRVSATNLVSSVAIPPLGMAYLAGTLEGAGHSVSVVDGVGEGLGQVYSHGGRELQGLTFQEILERIDPNADVIGVGLMFSCSWPVVRDLVRMIKTRFPNTPLIMGGEHPTALPELVFEQSPTDVIVTGEGEESLLEWCDRMAIAKVNSAKSDAPLALPTDVAGTMVRTGGKVHANPRRSRIRNVDDIPLPAWEHFNVERYIDHRQPHGSADGRSMPMLATRGCPYQCTFCGSPGMWGTSWRPRDVKRVVDEMELYMRRYRANDFHFEDLTAVVRRDWILDFCREIVDRNLEISWQLPSGTRSEAIDGEVSRAMFAAGCRQFSYAFESGSPEMLEKIKKKIHLEEAFASAQQAMAAGIRAQCIFIYGFPGETWREMWQTYRTIMRCAVAGFHEVSICALSPLPNTEIFRQVDAERGIELKDAYFDSIFGYLSIWRQKSWNARLPDSALRLLILCSFASFFAVSFAVRPTRALGLVRGLLSGSSGGKLGRILKGLVGNLRVMRRGRSAAGVM